MEELHLLEEINTTLPEKTQERFDELDVKLQDRTLTEAERKEFLTIVDSVEELDNKRAKALIKLAQIKNITTRQLMKDLGITPEN